MMQPNPWRSRILRDASATDIVYGVIGALLLVSSIAKVLSTGVDALDVVALVTSAMLVGAALRGRNTTT